jgi:hypothetical protein
MRSDDAPDVLAIDDADLFAGELASIARDIVSSENHPLVLLEIRSGKVDRVLNPAQLAGVPTEEVSMPLLADPDIGSLIDALDTENRLGLLKGKPRLEQERAFRDQARRQLLVAMYQATSGGKFEEKATDELFELEGDAQFIHGLIATASAFRYGLQRDEVVIATGDRSNTSLNTIEQLSRRHLISVSEDGRYLRARHRIIASILLKALIERGQLAEVLYGSILVAATKVTQAMSRSGRPCRLLRTFLNRDFLYRALDAEGARSIYGLVEQLLSWHSQYWLQRGSLEVEVGDPGLAENFLSQAMSLAPEDPFVQNEWAYLLFKKALRVPGAIDAPGFVKEATGMLQNLIDTRRAAGEHPYHVLGSQGLAWARRGIRDEEETARYLRKLISCVENGCEKYPQSDELRQLLHDLKRELLLLATPNYGRG